MQAWFIKRWFWLLVNVAAALPLLLLVWDQVMGNLSVNPIADFTTRTGKAALIMLMLSLACTPANRILGFRKAQSVRKSLGLWAFAYAGMHLLVFVGLDYGFDIQFLLDDTLLSKRYILVGLLAFIILIPLAVTSTRGWIKRLGRNWIRLHRLVYAAGVLVVLHFVWVVKGETRPEPFIYAAILTVLLLLRIPPIRNAAVKLRYRITGKPGAKKRAQPTSS